MGEDRTGSWVEAGTNDQIARLLSSSIEQNGPTYGHASFQTPSGLWVKCRWVNLPLASDGVVIDRLLVGMVQVPCQVSLSMSVPKSEQDIWSILLPPL
jgi:hypothetical protein